MTENKIIETLDYLFEKFGIAVDWTTENVMPYVQELAEKIVTYKIVTNSTWILISVIIIIACCIYLKKMHTSYKQCEITKESNVLWKYYKGVYSGESVDLTDTGKATAWVMTFVFPFGFIAFICSFSSLLKWIFIPEIQLIEYVSNLVNYLQV